MNDLRKSRSSMVYVEQFPRIHHITAGGVEVSIEVIPSLFPTLEQLAREFSAEQEDVDDISEIELYRLFMQFIVEYETKDLNLCVSPLLKAVYEQFVQTYLQDMGVHALNLDEQTRVEMITTCNIAFKILKQDDYFLECDAVPHFSSKSALFELVTDQKLSVLSTFGGQGANDVVGEIRKVYNTYPVVQDFVKTLCTEISSCVNSKESEVLRLHPYGLDILRWIKDSSTEPNEEYTLSCSVSFPVIAVTQLTHYYLFLKVLNIPPCEVLTMTKGLTGHSQGIVSAVVVASSLDFDSYLANCVKGIKLMFWLGCRIQQVYPITTLPPTILTDSLEHEEGVPTPMLAISRLPVDQVEQRVRAANEHLPDHRQICISLVNGPRSVVVSGHPQSLYGLHVMLREFSNKDNEVNEGRIPFSQRKQKLATKYLPVTAPFHSQYLTKVPELMQEDIRRENLEWSSNIELPVFSTKDGSDLRESTDITKELIRLIAVCPVDWVKATSEKVSYMLDFGPGGLAGVGSISHRNKKGSGCRIAMMSAESSTNPEVLCKADIFSSIPLVPAEDWGKEYAPKLVKLTNSGNVHISTKMSELLGKPPIMVAGMTPTTVNPTFVSACLNAGYHVELAGGGHYNEKSMTNAIEEILRNTEHGTTITVNVLFLNVRQWSFQFPLILKLRNQGYPIDGICIAAGVPSLDNANEILAKCQESGLKHVSFKPGSIESIRQVLGIADANPKFPIIMQWTGGRAGGHHSFEDFHYPILHTYSEIRKRKNIVLVAGSGFGDAHGCFPYLTGKWSSKFQYSSMPFDGILMGSRVMVAQEAKTSDPVKDHLALKCEGISHEMERAWEKSYTGIVGGITTVMSELGEPIHKVATRGVLLWKEFDETIFSLPKKDQLSAVLKKKDYIISRLNKDAQKVYFGRKKDGSVADVDGMTYAEVILRLIDLLYVYHQRRWIHVSFSKLVFDFITRAVARLDANISSQSILDVLNHNYAGKDDTKSLKTNIEELLGAVPLVDSQYLNSQDVDYFLSICGRRGQKPVPFIPILDENFKMYFKKDSLWQSEDIDAVIDQDVGRVCILQGPVAVKFSTKANEPVKDILDGSYQGLISMFNNKQSTVHAVDSLGGLFLPGTLISTECPGGVDIVATKNVTRYTLTSNPAKIPEEQEWIQFLTTHSNRKYAAHHTQTWLSTLLTTPDIVQNSFKSENAIRKLFSPRAGQVIRVESDEDQEQPKSIELYDVQFSTFMDPTYLKSKPAPVVSATYNAVTGIISVFLNEHSKFSKDNFYSLELKFKYLSENGYAPLHELMNDRNDRINDFYSKLWFGVSRNNLISPKSSRKNSGNEENDNDSITSFELINEYDVSFGNDDVICLEEMEEHKNEQTNVEKEELTESKRSSSSLVPKSCSYKVTREDIISFCYSVNYTNEISVERGQNQLEAPIDFAIVIAWKAIMSALLSSGVNGDLTKLVHLSNSFNLISGARPFMEGDECQTRAHVVNVSRSKSGDMTVGVSAILGRKKNVDLEAGMVMEVKSEFLYRNTGAEDAYGHVLQFEKKEETPYEVVLRSFKDLNVLQSKTWIHWEDFKDFQDILKPGITLTFNIKTIHSENLGSNTKNIHSTGKVTLRTESDEIILLGQINYNKQNVKGNAVMEYLSRNGQKVEQEVFFENGGYSVLPKSRGYSSLITAPPHNKGYAQASGDSNPIHVNPYIANFSDLPGTITHGMWTSASTRRLVEVFAADNEPQRVVSYSVNFLGMVLPGDKLETKLTHVGMADGKMIVNVDTINQEGSKVLHGVAQIKQPTTAYVFTGQGSQGKGMGMDLYTSSTSAKKIWDKADAHFRSNYGFSILNIVKNNPLECRVYFGGAKGKEIREMYMAMTYDSWNQSKKEMETLPLFPDIENDTPFYTFTHPDGLLAATQFTQPALVLYEKAAFEDMRSRGLIRRGSTFAGHSLGEYAALASFGNVLPIASLMDVVFYRGMTMQYAVKRNPDGTSNYGMMAVNPTRVGGKFNEGCLSKVCEAIVILNENSIVDIVNHNVENWQYVVAGDLTNLATLTLVLNMFKKNGFDFSKFKEQGFLTSVVQQCLAVVTRKKIVVLERGVATIPLPGIDVPFHSRFLLNGVGPFRSYLKSHLDRNIDMSLLVNQYIPNLTAQPFEITKQFFEQVRETTHSEELNHIAHMFEIDSSLMTAKNKQYIGYVLLIELLAYQFASPVQWIKSQDQIFGKRNIERLVEIGPSATLSGMAKRTLSLKYDRHDKLTSKRRSCLTFEKDRQVLYFDFAVEEDAEESTPVSTASLPSVPDISSITMSVTAPITPSGPSQSGNLSNEIIVRGIVALKTKKSLGEISKTSTVKDLVGGKSTLQNEIMGDISAEFGISSLPEGGEEMSLSELSEKINSGSGRLGKVLKAKTSRMSTVKFPAGFSIKNVYSYLETEYNVKDGLADGILLQMVCSEPNARLGNEEEVKKFIDESTNIYQSVAGVSLGKRNTPPPPAAAAAAVSQQIHVASAVVGSVADVSTTPLDFIRTLVALKLKKKVADIQSSTTLRNVVAGKSTLQNELLGDIQIEFGSSFQSPSEPGDLPLETLANNATSYSAPGKVAKGLIARLISSKLPGGFNNSSVKDYLTTKYGMGPNMIDGILLHSTTLEPPGRLPSKQTAEEWLDSVVSSYTSTFGVSLSSSSAPSSNGSMVMSAGNIDIASSGAYQENLKKQQQLLLDNVAAINHYLGKSGREHYDEIETVKQQVKELENKQDLITAEHGDFYTEGIRGKFSKFKVRKYDSYWNWSRQDFYKFNNKCMSLMMAEKTSDGKNDGDNYLLLKLDWNRIVNRLSIHVKDSILCMLDSELGKWVCDNIICDDIADVQEKLINSFAQGCDSVYKKKIAPLRPKTDITDTGKLVYSEVERTINYVTEIQSVMELCAKEKDSESQLFSASSEEVLRKTLEEMLQLHNHEQHEQRQNVVEKIDMFMKMCKSNKRSGIGDDNEIPLVNLKRQNGSKWVYDKDMTQNLFNSISNIQENGISLKDKMVLITGCGRGSIGEAILDALLAAGAQVVVTSSSFTSSSLATFRNKYETLGGKGSSLTVVPFNQGSIQDCKNLVDYIYDDLKMDLDYIIPFAAISENGRMINGVDDRSELAHRMMLTNIVRLLGAIKDKKLANKFDTRPSMVILPLSPNHGVFGGDGLYAESKIGLETLFNKWKSEDWAQYLTLAGACIGWTRGTGLMSANNIIADGVEKMGIRTFTTTEMALNIVALMDLEIVKIVTNSPVWADFTGGMDLVSDLDQAISNLRNSLNEESSALMAVKNDEQMDLVVEHGLKESIKTNKKDKLANLKVEFPALSSYEQLEKENGHMKGMIDLEKTVVVTGYGEVGPWGNSRTRWEMEANGVFSLEGCIEMAWIMGFIKHFNGQVEKQQYSGWINIETNKPIKDYEIKQQFEEKILEHAGIRIIEPELFDGYDPAQKQFVQQVAIERDIGPLECTDEEAAQYKREHGDHVDVYITTEGTWVAVFKKGCQLYIPKSLRFDRYVAGQIPTGWSAARYGVPEDIVNQVDPVTLFNIVSTVEALVASGISDPYEFYEYVHVSEVGNTTGGGVGGMKANIQMYKDRFTDPTAVQGDILQESFINTMPAWINLLLLSSSGPIKTPVGACATAVESVEIGCDCILSGKAKIVIVGGYDDFQEQGSYEFAQMRATSNSEEETKMGRSPKEMSRPATSSRGGFMEAQGSGNQILMSAALAIKMGVPIYGIIGLTNTATDKEGRSIPAPGQGILTTAREYNATAVKAPKLLNFEYRRRQIKFKQSQIKVWLENEIEELKRECEDNTDSFQDQRQEIEAEASKQMKAAVRLYGNEFYQGDSRISPLRGALSVYGLTVDDIDVASFHGTGTKANDKNESDVLNQQLKHLGRTKGNYCPGVFQKYLTGHPKGAAAAWMLNGVFQMMQYTTIPGNRNADNIDIDLEKFDNILYPSRTLKPACKIKAGLVKSFGFGQVGGECLVIHPDYVLGALGRKEYENYMAKRTKREVSAFRHIHDSMSGKTTFVRVKNEPPYSEKNEASVYLNPNARASYHNQKKTWMFDEKSLKKGATLDNKCGGISMNEKYTKEILSQAVLTTSMNGTTNLHQGNGVGVDVEPISEFNVHNENFIERNFTQREIDYCRSQPDPRASFTGKWCAKEAVIKAVSNYDTSKENGWKGATAPLKEIEILASVSKSPQVEFLGEAKLVIEKSGVKEVSVSISHSGDYAVAVASAK